MLKKTLKWTGISLLSLIAVVIIGLLISGHGYLLRAIRVTYFTGHKTAFLEDYKYFSNRTIATGIPQPWPVSKEYNTIESTAVLDSIHKTYKSVAYLIIKNDSLWFEEYYDGYNKDSKTNSFSMSKSIVAAALGKAVELGYIKSMNDKVKNYLPELTGQYADNLTIRDLVTMQSGLQWDESYYSPFSILTRAYFDNNLSTAMIKLPISSPPQQGFKYQSGDTQLLAMVLSKAVPMTLSEFVSTYLWQPIHAEQEALWQYNEADGIEKAYCCIASNARDFARFGKLYLHKGKWNDQQILDSSYIDLSTTASDEQHPVYGYGWWLGEYQGKKIVYMDGHLGQYVIGIPEDDILIVRLGHTTDKRQRDDPQSAFYQYIDQAYKMIGK